MVCIIIVSAKHRMPTQLKVVVLAVVLLLGAALLVALALLIPGILIFKLTHGASKPNCSALLATYVAIWGGLLLCLSRMRKPGHDAVFGVVWGLCFFTLLFLSWRV